MIMTDSMTRYGDSSQDMARIGSREENPRCRIGRRPSFEIDDPQGQPITIPASATEDSPYFSVHQAKDIREYYAENGYVVVRKLIPGEMCEKAQGYFAREVLPFGGHIYRQTTANPERHTLTEHGFMLNPILNNQSLDDHYFRHFRETGLAILTDRRVQTVLNELLHSRGQLV